MKEYVCTVCGYVHKGELPEAFVCPVCGAGPEAFKPVEKKESPKAKVPRKSASKAPETEFSAIEMSVICSNLARGAEKQYKPDLQERFEKLARFFLEEAQAVFKGKKSAEELLNEDLSDLYPEAHAAAAEASDRGAKRSLAWSEKVATALKSLIARYGADGAKIPDGQSVYVCSVCGFVFAGKEPPAICPVCKVPSWKFEKVERRAKKKKKNMRSGISGFAQRTVCVCTFVPAAPQIPRTASSTSKSV